MEFEQIVKRLEWLDEERRKDKVTIATLEERLSSLEAGTSGVKKQLNETGSDLARLGSLVSRVKQFEETMANSRVDFSRMVEEVEKHRAEREREVEKIRLGDLEANNKSLGELRKSLEAIPEIRQAMKARVEEEFRISRVIEEMQNSFEDIERFDEEMRRNHRLIEEGRRQDAKRLVDLQSETSGLRKILDEQRGKLDLMGDSVRKAEMRIGEVQAAETERRQGQNTFIEKQNLQQVERDRAWKEWEVRFEDFITKTVNLDTQLQTLDATNRAIRRSQEAFDEITERFERRVNEITEMQRLAEERFRQEWVAFKADDQKRWTNYLLTTEEQQREVERQFTQSENRLVSLEDSSQEIQDVLQQITDDLQKRLQQVVTATHDWLDSFDNLYGRPR
jgi:DNA repair exonuclease SbcCD ATPase subunit